MLQDLVAPQASVANICEIPVAWEGRRYSIQLTIEQQIVFIFPVLIGKLIHIIWRCHDVQPSVCSLYVIIALGSDLFLLRLPDSLSLHSTFILQRACFPLLYGPTCDLSEVPNELWANISLMWDLRHIFSPRVGVPLSAQERP